MIIRTIDQSGYEISIPVYVSDTGYVMYGKGYGFKKQGRIRKPDKSAQVHRALSHFEQEAFVTPDSPVKTFMTLDGLMEANFKSSLKNLVTHFCDSIDDFYKLLMNPDGTTKTNFHVPKTFYEHIEKGRRKCSRIQNTFKHKNKTTILAQTGNVNTLLQNQSQGKKYSKPILDVIWDAYEQYCELAEHLVQHVCDINHYPILKFCPKTGFLLAPEPTTNRNMELRRAWKKFIESYQQKHNKFPPFKIIAREMENQFANKNKKYLNFSFKRSTHQLYKTEYKEGRLDWFFATHDLEVVIYDNNKAQSLPIK